MLLRSAPVSAARGDGIPFVHKVVAFISGRKPGPFDDRPRREPPANPNHDTEAVYRDGSGNTNGRVARLTRGAVEQSTWRGPVFCWTNSSRR